MQEIIEKLNDASKAEENRKKGELLTANIYRIQKGMTEIVVDDYYDGGEIKIGLDSTLPPAKNAQKYYKLYNKQKRTIEMLTPRRQEIEARLRYLDSMYFALDSVENKEELIQEIRREADLFLHQKSQKKKGKKEEIILSSPRRYEMDGFVVKAGKNNLQNDKLLKEAGGEDVWLHTQKYHSSHVIIFTQGKALTDAVLGAAAEICAYYSQAREGDKIPVDYCKRKHVKKAPFSAPGQVYYTDYKTVLVTPNPHKEGEV